MRYKMITYFQLEELILHHWNKALVINYKIGEGGGWRMDFAKMIVTTMKVGIVNVEKGS